MAGTSFGGNVFQEGNDEYGNEFSHQNSMVRFITLIDTKMFDGSIMEQK